MAMACESKDIKPDPDGDESHAIWIAEKLKRNPPEVSQPIKKEIVEETNYDSENNTEILQELEIEYDPLDCKESTLIESAAYRNEIIEKYGECSRIYSQITSSDSNYCYNAESDKHHIQIDYLKSTTGQSQLYTVKYLDKRKHYVHEKTDIIKTSNPIRKKEPKVHQCHICDCKLTSSSNLKRHILIHSGEKPFKCDICSYRCTSMSHLRRHNMTHSGEKPFECNLCPYRCTLLRNFKIHEMMHRGERPNKCDVCPYKCTSSSDLKKHKTMHTGEKAFRCDICDCRFTRSDSLKKHKKIHTRLAKVK